MNPRPSRNLHILGSRVDLVTLGEIRDRLDGWIRADDRRCRMMAVTGFHGLWEAHRNPAFGRILRSADLWVPDGIAPIAVARIKGFSAARRTPGMDVMRTFLDLANEKGYSSYFYGDTDDTLTRLRANLERDYPNHRVAGTFSPPFRPLTPEEDREIVEMINAARPDVVWVGLGLPKQDIWVHEHRDRLDARAAIGVGAAFGFLAGKVKRCPDWLGNRGLEWAYRFAMEPRKLWRRDLLDGPRFLWHVGLELAGLRKYD
jgi:N-acetylglucosaminyldiphosphoundecaprenol N-acetyl-beta-D-mannosaminyltransferase